MSFKLGWKTFPVFSKCVSCVDLPEYVQESFNEFTGIKLATLSSEVALSSSRLKKFI